MVILVGYKYPERESYLFSIYNIMFTILLQIPLENEILFKKLTKFSIQQNVFERFTILQISSIHLEE